MKKVLVLCMLGIFFVVACNKSSKEEVRPMKENKEKILNIQDTKIEKKISYSMQSYGKVYQAVLTGDVNNVKQALSTETDDRDKFCALDFIIGQGYKDSSKINIEIVKLLLTAKTNVNVRMIKEDYIDNSLLEKATLANSATLVKLLLEAGANTESKNRSLNLAVSENYIEIIKSLLSAGIEDSAKNEALSIAINSQHFEVAEILLSAGAKAKGDSLAAAVEGTPALVKLVLNAGAEKNDKRKALIKAINSSNVEIVKLLLEAGTDIKGYKKNAENSSQGAIRVYDMWEDSALETALYRQKQIQSSKNSLQKEIEMESDPNCLGCGPDEEEFSRLEHLKKEEKKINEIINLLKAAGAKE